MYKYNVKYFPDGDIDCLLLGASILFDYRPEFRCGFDKKEFLETCVEEMHPAPLIACFQGNTFCGALNFTHPRRDVHHTGTGRSVLSMSVVPGRRGVFIQLVRELERIVRSEKGSWISIPKRLNPREVKIIYRSV